MPPPSLRNLFLRSYLAIAFVSLTALVFLTPPLEVPDEKGHFLRAYMLSEWQVRPLVQGDDVGAVLPTSLETFSSHFDPLHPTSIPLGATWSLRSLPLAPEIRSFQSFPNIAYYSPVPYIPSALAIAAGRWAGAGPLGLLWLGRAANAACAMLLTVVALAWFRKGQGVAFVVALFPMVQYLYASLSADALTIASALLGAGAASRMMAGERPAAVRAAFGATSVAMSAVKVTNVLLTFALLPLAFRRPRLATAWVVPCLASVLVVAWLATTREAVVLGSIRAAEASGLRGVDSEAQLLFLLTHPLDALRILLVTLATQARFLIGTGVGFFGWLTLRFPEWLYAWVLATAALGFLVQPGTRGALALNAWIVVCCVATAIAVVLAMALQWTAVGAPVVAGLQGRYFLPIVPFAALVAQDLVPVSLAERPRFQVGLLCVISCAAFTLVMHVVQIDTYRLFS